MPKPAVRARQTTKLRNPAMPSGYVDNETENRSGTPRTDPAPRQPCGNDSSLRHVTTTAGDRGGRAVADEATGGSRAAADADEPFDAFVRGQFSALSSFGRLLTGHEAAGQDLV